jgi:hypothetical protein
MIKSSNFIAGELKIYAGRKIILAIIFKSGIIKWRSVNLQMNLKN